MCIRDSVSLLRDDSDAAEFVFRVYAFFADEAAADRYVRNTCGEVVQDYDIDVVRTCKWVRVQSMRSGADAGAEVFRSDELNRVMQSHRRAPRDAERFYREQSLRPESSAAGSSPGTAPGDAATAPDECAPPPGGSACTSGAGESPGTLV